MWQKANDDEKAPYIAMSNQDKQRYQAELEAYNYRSPPYFHCHAGIFFSKKGMHDCVNFLRGHAQCFKDKKAEARLHFSFQALD